jgi:hypothetical protein
LAADLVCIIANGDIKKTKFELKLDGVYTPLEFGTSGYPCMACEAIFAMVAESSPAPAAVTIKPVALII